jgi:hypothetical protein
LRRSLLSHLSLFSFFSQIHLYGYGPARQPTTESENPDGSPEKDDRVSTFFPIRHNRTTYRIAALFSYATSNQRNVYNHVILRSADMLTPGAPPKVLAVYQVIGVPPISNGITLKERPHLRKYFIEPNCCFVDPVVPEDARKHKSQDTALRLV